MSTGAEGRGGRGKGGRGKGNRGKGGERELGREGRRNEKVGVCGNSCNIPSTLKNQPIPVSITRCKDSYQFLHVRWLFDKQKCSLHRCIYVYSTYLEQGYTIVCTAISPVT